MRISGACRESIAPAGCVVLKEGQKGFPFALGNLDHLGGAQKTSGARAQELRTTVCLVRTPEICVEVLSAPNTPAVIGEKIALYFEAGAQEVWTCDQDGALEFHFSTPPKVRRASLICPEFPPVIRFSGE